MKKFGFRMVGSWWPFCHSNSEHTIEPNVRKMNEKSVRFEEFGIRAPTVIQSCIRLSCYSKNLYFWGFLILFVKQILGFVGFSGLIMFCEPTDKKEPNFFSLDSCLVD